MKNIINNIKENYKLIIGVFVIGILIGFLINTTCSDLSESPNHQISESSDQQITKSSDQIYTCSMHPQIRQKGPGLCPICAMELIPAASTDNNQTGTNPNEIQMTESAAQLANIQTVVVDYGKSTRDIHLLGRVEADESKMSEITARFNGRIEKLYINFTGQNITKGQPLAKIYSPQLVTAQKELLEAAKYKESNPEFYNSVKGKLKLWDLTEKQIENIIKTGEPIMYFDILSPISGTVKSRHISIGDYVKQGQQMFMVADLSSLWIMFDAYQADLPWISVNDNVEFNFSSISGKVLKGKVKYIDPVIDSKTRVAKVRVEYANSDLSIKPEMFVDGVIKSNIGNSKNKLIVPKTAVLWTGKRAVVYVKIADRKSPTFLYRQIVLGPEAGNYYVVEDGLKQGEEIATNGVFKIDASAQLMGLQSMMNPEGGVSVTGHNHGDEETAKKDEAIDVDVKFKKQLTNVYQKYLLLKDAFVASDAKKASTNAKEIAKAISSVDMKLVKGDAHLAWMEQMIVLNESINTIGKTSDIEEQRKAFSAFNLAFYNSVKMFGLESKITYYQYCPMANSDKGAYWFSESKEIKNPYFGDKMLKCGEVKQVIEFK